MIDYTPFLQALGETRLAPWAEPLRARLAERQAAPHHGDWPRWQEALEGLPQLSASVVELVDAVRVGTPGDCSEAMRAHIATLLRELHPWRKGPFHLHGIHIDTEWRSDWKWERVKDHLQPLEGRLVLDVGCGNGYHCWRMLGAGAARVIGIDPTWLSVVQFHAVKHFIGPSPVDVLPLRMEELPPDMRAFDTIFSMGVLYHRRAPFDHLQELKGALRPGGELVLETLVIEGGAHQVLVPEGRYAKMRNVWFLPTPETLAGWLRRLGFRDVRVVDVTPTTTDEQRATEWMRFESLRDYLDPANPRLTVEGLPAPIRATLLATAP